MRQQSRYDSNWWSNIRCLVAQSVERQTKNVIFYWCEGSNPTDSNTFLLWKWFLTPTNDVGSNPTPTWKTSYPPKWAQCVIFPSLSHRQIAFLGPLEWRNLFGPKDKVSSHEKLVFKSGVRFLILFVLTDAILLKLDLQKMTSVLDNPPNGKLFV